MTQGQVPQASNSIIDVRALSKVFGEGRRAFTALDDVSVSVKSNEFFTLLGPSGCGKTTLLRLIAGFEQPTQGEILLNGEEISPLPPFKRQINTVFQNYALFPHMTVAQNIAFGLEMLERPAAKIKRIVDEMLELVQMQDMASRGVAEISGGQQQRVALARALAPQPKLLLLDEPLSALDLKLRKEMQVELKRLQHETGITFIFVTHDQDEALTMSDRIAVMKAGKILQIGTPRDIYDRPQHRFVADFIGDINILSATSLRSEHGKTTLEIDEVGTIDAVAEESLKRGDRVSIAIRPERIRLAKEPMDNRLQGRLTNIVYHGSDTLFQIDIAPGQALQARLQNLDSDLPVWNIGDTIYWSVESRSVAIMDADQ